MDSAVAPTAHASNATEPRRINPLTLTFTGSARDAEAEFRRNCLYGPDVVPHVRWAIVTALTLYLAFGVLDLVRAPEMAARLWWIRLGIGIPTGILAYSFTFHRAFERYGQQALMAMVILGGMGVNLMIAVRAAPIGNNYYAGLLLVCIYGYTLLRLRFIWSSLAGIIIVAGYLVTAGVVVNTPTVILINNSFYLVCTNFLGMIMAFSMEFAWRRGYLLEQDLLDAQAHLAATNQDLEQRVVERTEQLRDKNSTLKHEIAERQQIQLALIENKNRLNATIEAAQAGIVAINATSGAIVQANPMAETLAGVPHGGLLQQDHAAIFGNLIPIRDDPTPSGEPSTGALRTTQGERIPIQRAVVPVELNGDTHLLVSFSDIRPILAAEDRRHELQRHLEQSNRLNSLGTMAGGVAHDLNNLLYGMIGFAELALDDTPPDSRLHTNLQEILDGGRRAKATVEQMLAFSRQATLERDPVDLVSVIQRATDVMTATAPEKIRIQVRLSKSAILVYANTSQLHHVLIHLITNAIESIGGDGGDISIHLAQIDIDDDFVAPYPDATPGMHAHFRVSDTGKGIPPGILDRVFDPFFTTKALGDGQGMGLAATHGIVQRHNGIVTIDSLPGQGTHVDVYLPLIADKDLACIDPNGDTPCGTERILVVDDQLPMLKMTSQLIADLGYAVDQRTSSIEALGLVAGAPDRFDLVIVDHLMPNMNGLELASQIHTLRPSLPVIVCTGFSDRITDTGFRQAGLADLLNKPLIKSNVAQTIRRILDAKTMAEAEEKE